MVTDSATVTMQTEPIGNHRRSLFRMVPSLTPYYIPFPPNGVQYPPRYSNDHISSTGNPIHFMFGSRVGFSGSAERMALFPVTSNPSWRQAAILDNFEWSSSPTLGSPWWSCCSSHKDASIRSSQLRRSRTVHLKLSSSTDTQLSSDIRVPSWSEN